MRTGICFLAGIAGLALASTAMAEGTVIPFSVQGINSMDAVGNANNTVVILDVAAALGQASGTACVMNGIGWDVGLFADNLVGTFGGSYYSEIAVGFSANGDTTPDFNLRPGIADTFTGPGVRLYSSPVLKLIAVGLPEMALPDGKLRLEFFETFDDATGIADGQWVSGVLNVQAVVPAPGAAALLGLGGLVAARRRR